MKEWTYDPARDLNLPPTERWRSVRREAGMEELVAQTLWWNGIRLYLALFHRLRVEGRQHLPASPPFVVVANHASHLDAMVLAASLPARLRRCALPLAAGDTFFETPAVAAFAAVCLNALPLWRKRAGRHAMDDLRQRLVNERCGYILFPEGTRSRTGEIAPFKPGVGMLVAGTNVPVVPCHITGAFEAWPPNRRWPRPLRPIRVSIGTPLRFDQVSNNREGWTHVAATADAAMRALRCR